VLKNNSNVLGILLASTFLKNTFKITHFLITTLANTQQEAIGTE